MTPRIITSDAKKLIGKRMIMSFADYKVADLWKDFMARRKEILKTVSTDLISMTIYKPMHFKNFKPANQFEKWATVEVSDFDYVPDNMNTFELPVGLYAVFKYKGLNTDDTIYQYIFQDWLPLSDFDLDDRPHFEVLGGKYKNNSPDSEEEIWIPIKPKS